MSKKEQKYYRPLPESLTILNSPIEGIGLFATEDIKSYTCLGLTHVYDMDFEDGYIRTPLGGFINYSEDPNCEVNTTYPGQESNDNVNNLYLWTKKDIKEGEELTLHYILYDPTKDL